MSPFAHYWGIDEVGVFVIPAIVAIILLRWAERKAKSKSATPEEETEKEGVDG